MLECWNVDSPTAAVTPPFPPRCVSLLLCARARHGMSWLNGFLYVPSALAEHLGVRGVQNFVFRDAVNQLEANVAR